MTSSLFDALHRFNEEHLSFPAFAAAHDEAERLLALYRQTGLAQHLVVQGESGTGKTTLCQALLQTYPRYSLPERNVIPVLYIPIPPAATIAGVTEAMLAKLGDPSPSAGTISVKTARAIKLAKACGVELLLFDEAQHIQDRGQLPTQYMVGDWLKTIMDEVNVPTVLLGLPRLESLLRVNEQLRRRFTRRLNMALGQDTNCHIETECLQLVASLQPALPVPISYQPLGWVEFGHRLYFATDSRIAYVKALLSGAIHIVAERDLAEISLMELETAFTHNIWQEGIGALNPFNEKFEFRRLNRPGEPFERSIPTKEPRRSKPYVA